MRKESLAAEEDLESGGVGGGGLISSGQTRQARLSSSAKSRASAKASIKTVSQKKEKNLPFFLKSFLS